MLEIFYNGGVFFMGVITISAVVMLTLSVLSFRAVLTVQDNTDVSIKINLIREAGLFALIVGLFASTLDFIAAFSAIQMAGDISMSLLAAGLKMMIIPTAYGLMIYGLAVLISLFLNWKVTKVAL
ncbi:MAG: hypothetical protein Roseis2KO_46680 [Roseivirga sp.]